ncbi:ATP-binding protein [Myroides odoratimimus]|uniref:AlbA family DNA-binding domain-containing protein n=1 Tax=Myroides odoratimimus TaxID=76832 RepID=UPI002574FBE5|nr:ATP-binding protein [Myroides odoratimimus]MDM1410713.1 ATP-binding protein [Myroides odoratimimus]MEC4007704.1 ATP-binding protein [Myroides odoratimimus]
MELHKLEEYDWEFVNSLIKNNIEESINIDFKSADALSKVDSKKKEISKDVSAFANSNGGIIIYGIDEIDHKASSISFVDGNEFTKEWLEQVISSTIQRNIPNLKIFPIRKDGIIAQTIYVVQIPESLETPHIARDKKFYKRYNFESVAMEEYEIRQLYGRTVKSKLCFDDYNLSYQKLDEDNVLFKVDAMVFNDGEKPERDYKINVYLEEFSNEIIIKWQTNGNGKNYEYTKLSDTKIKITSPSITSIYPDETLNVIRFDFEIPIKNLEEIFSKLKIKFLLLYPNGQDEIETPVLNDFYIQIKKDLRL